MQNCGCGPDEACDVCDRDAVDQAIAAGAEPMLVDPEPSDGEGFSHADWLANLDEDEVPQNIILDGPGNDPDEDAVAEERAYMYDRMRAEKAAERGVDVDDLDGYFDRNDQWVDIGPVPRKGTLGRPHLDKRHRGN